MPIRNPKKIGFMIAAVVVLLILLAGVTVAVSTEIQGYIYKMFNPQSPQNTSGLSFEIDKIAINSSSGQISFNLKSTTNEKIKNNFRFKYLQICDQNDNVLIGIYNYVLNYNEVTDKTEVVFKSNYILENLGRRLTIKIIDLYYVDNSNILEIKIPLKDILMTGPDFSPSYATGDNVIKKIGIIHQNSKKNTKELTSKLIYESTRKDLDNKSITFSVFNQNDELISKEENVYDFSNNESLSTTNASGFTLAEIWEDKITTGGQITYPDGDLSNYYLKIEYADYISYRNGEWTIDFIPAEGFDDYKYTKPINQSLKLELQNKSNTDLIDILVEKVDFTTSQTIVTVKIAKEFLNSYVFESFVSNIRIDTAFDSYKLIEINNLSNDSEVDKLRVELVFPTVAGDRDPVLMFGESCVECIPLDTTYEYIRFRQAIGFGTKMSIEEVKTYIEDLKIPELISTINNTFINKISNDEFGVYSIAELYDGTEIYIYNDTYDKIAAYYPKTKTYEIIYDPAQIPVKPKDMTDEEWLEKKTISENLIRNCTPDSMEDLVKMFGTPNKQTSTPDGTVYTYRSNIGREYCFIDNGIRFDCYITIFIPYYCFTIKGIGFEAWKTDYYLFSKPSSRTMLKVLDIAGAGNEKMPNGEFKKDILYYGASVEKITRFYGVADETEGANLFYKLSGEFTGNQYAILIFDDNRRLIELFVRKDLDENIQFDRIYLESRKFQDNVSPERKHAISELKDLEYARTIDDVKHIWGAPFEEINDAVTIIKYKLTDGRFVEFWSDGIEFECTILKSNSISSWKDENNRGDVFRKVCKTGKNIYKHIKK